MSAAIAALGGQWRTALTRDVTHLFALAPGSVKYETAMHFRDTTGMCILVPHWFDDSVRLGIKGLPTKSYEWPEPRVFHARSEGRTPEEELEFKIPAKRRLLYDTALMNDGDTPPTKAPSGNVWNGLRILLSTTLELSDSQRAAHEADIIRQGGVVVGFDSPQSADTQTIRDEELKKIDEADVFVTRYRTGAAYVKAFKLHKTIGNISWLWFVRLSGVLSRPTDQLLHYPLPKKPIENFSSHVITITTIPVETGILIAAYMGGPKTTKAVGWSIPIVNHTWLEDCFVQWHSVTPARDKYIVFPPGVDFSTLLAERGVGRVGWEPAELEALALEENEDDMLAKSDKGPTAPSGTANSAREVENVVTIASDDEDIRFGRPMDIDVELTMKVQKDGDADMEMEDEVARNAKLGRARRRI
ncbi:BRCT-containing protein 1 [Grifola frondosa]|uniref:BRCT-containing protein 1 n=1 Tax=Grifola frondosa TaxID=5627 RepID=A0A1C7MRA1_GRIFR|nr:BRCT-containing protein 1 [Grifola frondosa]